MKKYSYSTPTAEIILLNTKSNMMDEAPVNPFSDTTNQYDANTATMDMDELEEDVTRKSNLWE